MKETSFSQAIQDLLRRDPRYPEPAYFFVHEGLGHTLKLLAKDSEPTLRHISGQQFCEGLRDLAIKSFGPMSKRVLAHWGIFSTRDFGQIVYNLIGEGILGKNEADRQEDFETVYDFEEAFCHPFQPQHPPQNQPDQRRQE